jgi:hypothetical protein
MYEKTLRGHMPVINIVRLLAVTLYLVLINGCAVNRPHSEAYIQDDINWNMIKQPGYEYSSTDVDVLEGNDISIRIEAFNGIINEDIFTITVMFFTDNKTFQFNPSEVYVELSNQTIIKAKGLPCAHTLYDLNYLRGVLPIEVATPVDEQIKGYDKLSKCFVLFFDTQPPSVNEEFVMYLNGLTKSGQLTNIPKIHFRNANRS